MAKIIHKLIGRFAQRQFLKTLAEIILVDVSGHFSAAEIVTPNYSNLVLGDLKPLAHLYVMNSDYYYDC